MDVRCERCSTEYEFDDALVSERGTTVKCTNCGYKFRIFPPRATRQGPDQWVVRTDGGTRVYRTLRQLQQAIGEGDVGPQDMLSRGPGPARALGAIAELEPFFSARSSRGRRPDKTLIGVAPPADGEPLSTVGGRSLAPPTAMPPTEPVHGPGSKFNTVPPRTQDHTARRPERVPQAPTPPVLRPRKATLPLGSIAPGQEADDVAAATAPVEAPKDAKLGYQRRVDALSSTVPDDGEPATVPQDSTPRDVREAPAPAQEDPRTTSPTKEQAAVEAAQEAPASAPAQEAPASAPAPQDSSELPTQVTPAGPTVPDDVEVTVADDETSASDDADSEPSPRSRTAVSPGATEPPAKPKPSDLAATVASAPSPFEEAPAPMKNATEPLPAPREALPFVTPPPGSMLPIESRGRMDSMGGGELSDPRFVGSQAQGLRSRWIVGVVIAGAVVLLASTVGVQWLKGYRDVGGSTAVDDGTMKLLDEGRVALARGELDEARDAFQKASGRAPDSPVVTLELARLEVVTADLVWLKLRLLDPTDEAIVDATHRELGARVGRARKALARAQEAGAKGAPFTRSRIDVLRMEGKLDEARKLVTELTRESTTPTSGYVLAALDLAEKEPLWSSVLERLRGAAISSEHAGRAEAALVYALVRAGRQAKAEAELEKLVRRDRPHPLIVELKAFAARMNGTEAKAASSAQVLDPTSLPGLDTAAPLPEPAPGAPAPKAEPRPPRPEARRPRPRPEPEPVVPPGPEAPAVVPEAPEPPSAPEPAPAPEPPAVVPAPPEPAPIVPAAPGDRAPVVPPAPDE